MKKTFADAYFYIALLNPGDFAHRDALAATTYQVGTIVTTQWVLTEVADAFSAPRDRLRFTRLLRSLVGDRNTLIVPATSESFDRGTELFSARGDKHWSLTDCISFVVMEQHQITEVLTGDRHFVQAGYKALLTVPGDF